MSINQQQSVLQQIAKEFSVSLPRPHLSWHSQKTLLFLQNRPPMDWPKHPRVTQVSQLCPSCFPAVTLWAQCSSSSTLIKCSPAHQKSRMGRIQLGVIQSKQREGGRQGRRGRERCLSWAGGVGRKRIRASSVHLCILEEQKGSDQREPPALPRCHLASPGD